MKRAFLVAAAACALAASRVPLGARSHTSMLAVARTGPPSLAEDPLVRASLASPYSLFPRLASAPLAALQRRGLPARRAAWALHLFLWFLIALELRRLALLACGSQAAADAAVLLFGLQFPVGPGSVPYGLPPLDRAAGLLPLLAAVRACLEGRRWSALGLTALATYVHANPALHAWPWLLAEDSLEAWKNPSSRRAWGARLAAAALAAAPLALRAGGDPYAEAGLEHARASLALFWPYVGGGGLGRGDIVFSLLGLALTALCLGSLAPRVRPPLIRLGALTLAMLAFGSLAQALHAPGARFWGFAVKLQPWVAWFFLDITGILAVAASAAAAAEAGSPSWPLLAWSSPFAYAHDWLARAAALAALAPGRGATAAARLAAGALLALSASAALFPAASLSALRLLGLRGGALASPSLSPASAALLAAAWLLPSALLRRAPTAALGAALAAGAAATWIPWRDRPFYDAADWVRENTPPSSLVLMSPMGYADCVSWIARAERPLMPCCEDNEGPMLYMSGARAMGERLKAAGIDLSRVLRFEDISGEIARADAAFTFERAAELARKRGVTHLLLSSSRPWPGRPLAVFGPWALHEAPR